MKINNELKKHIAISLGLSIKEITAKLAAGDVDTWDSLGHFKLILCIEENFKVKFRTEQIPELVTVGKIQDELDARGVFNGRNKD